MTYIFWIAALELLKKPLKLDAVDRCNLIYSNVGNLALPLINMILGSEYVFYASALQIPFNFLIWSHGNSIISGTKHLHFKKDCFQSEYYRADNRLAAGSLSHSTSRCNRYSHGKPGKHGWPLLHACHRYCHHKKRSAKDHHRSESICDCTWETDHHAGELAVSDSGIWHPIKTYGTEACFPGVLYCSVHTIRSDGFTTRSPV